MNDKILELANKASIVVVLVAILIAGSQGYWIWGSELTAARADIAAIKQERDSWKQLALKGTALAEVASQPIRVIGMAPPTPVKANVEAVSDRLNQIEAKVADR